MLCHRSTTLPRVSYYRNRFIETFSELLKVNLDSCSSKWPHTQSNRMQRRACLMGRWITVQVLITATHLEATRCARITFSSIKYRAPFKCKLLLTKRALESIRCNLLHLIVLYLRSITSCMRKSLQVPHHGALASWLGSYTRGERTRCLCPMKLVKTLLSEVYVILVRGAMQIC